MISEFCDEFGHKYDIKSHKCKRCDEWNPDYKPLPTISKAYIDWHIADNNTIFRWDNYTTTGTATVTTDTTDNFLYTT